LAEFVTRFRNPLSEAGFLLSKMIGLPKRRP